MSSSLSRIFSSTAKKLNTIATTKKVPTSLPKAIADGSSSTKSDGDPTIKSMVNSIFKERNLSILAKKFKESSEIRGFRGKHRVYQATVRRLASAKRFSSIEEILEQHKKYPEIATEGFALRIIGLYGQAGMFDHASKMFDEMPELKCNRTVKAVNALLNAGVDSQKFDEVEKLFQELPARLEVTPDAYSYNIMIRAYCEMGSLDSALSMLNEMEEKGLKPTIITFNTILHGCFDKTDRFEDGEKIWKRMENSDVDPDIRSFNAKTRGFVKAGKISEAAEFVEKFKSKGIEPDVFSYNALIKGLCNEGKLEEAKKVYDMILKNDIVPIRATIETLIPVLCENEDYGLALKLCKESLKRNTYITENFVQMVIDGLVKKSKVEDAKKLAELGWSKSYSTKRLTLPSATE